MEMHHVRDPSMNRDKILLSSNSDLSHLECSEILRRSQLLEQQGQQKDSLNLMRRWLTKNPNSNNSFAVWYEFGRLLQIEGEFQKAEGAFRAALEQKPLFFEGRLALGKALESQGKLRDAIEAWSDAVPKEDLEIDLLNNIARVRESQQDLEALEQTLLRSLKLNPQQDAVITTLLQVRQKLCRWPVISDELPLPIKQQEQNVGPLMSLALADDPDKNLTAAKSFVTAKQLNHCIYPRYKTPENHGNRTRIGFLSADFRLHATSVFFSPLIALANKEKYETFLLDITTTEDAFPQHRQQLIKSAEHHIPLQHLNDTEAIEICREQHLDIVVDLTGLTSGARPRLIAERIARSQISYIGFLASTSILNSDYIVTTPDLFDGCEQFFTEKPLFISGTYICLDESPEQTTTITRDALGVPSDAFIFSALLNTYKITPSVFECWMKILEATPNSILWLIEDNKTTKQNLINEAAKYKIDPNRLLFSKRVHPAIYRNQLAVCDLFLDAFPYGSGATARDAIHANLPILCKPGRTMMSRLSAHMMRHLGLPELICDSTDAYVSIASHLGTDRKKTADLKKRMESNKSASLLYDRRQFVENFYDGMSHILEA